MDLETAWYEISPYVYAVAGAVSIFNVSSALSVFSGVLLLGAAATIVRMRWRSRRKADSKVKKAF